MVQSSKEACGDLTLVQVFTSDTSGSLEAAGITADTALFVELV